MADKVYNVYNLSKNGVDVDTDSVHVLKGSFRQAQNIHRNPVSGTTESIISRKGLRSLNSVVMGVGPILGGVVIPSFEAGTGVSTMYIGFGD